MLLCLVGPTVRHSHFGQAITGWDASIGDVCAICPPDVTGEFIARSNKAWVNTTGYYKKPAAALSCLKKRLDPHRSRYLGARARKRISACF